jgi:hypothetical protein
VDHKKWRMKRCFRPSLGHLLSMLLMRKGATRGKWKEISLLPPLAMRSWLKKAEVRRGKMMTTMMGKLSCRPWFLTPRLGIVTSISL